MSQSLSLDVVTRVMGRIPGVVFSTRTEPTGRAHWEYINAARAAELYDVSVAELEADPNLLLERVVPEDRTRLLAQMARAAETGAPMTWSGRIRRRDGEVRWIETQATVERDAGGAQIWSGQTLDISGREDLERALAASESAREKSDALHRAVIQALPVGIVVMDPNGTLPIINATWEAQAGPAPSEHRTDSSVRLGLFLADGVTPFPNERLPLVRAMRGEEAVEEMVVRNSHLEAERRLLVAGRTLRDAAGNITAGLIVSQDVTMQRLLEIELRTRNEELAQSESAKAQLIERLRFSIDELSTPILEVWDDVLAMPIIGVVDSRRTQEMVQRLLGEVARTQASFVIIDLTGVEIVDTKTADHLMKLMRKVEIVGARCVLTGIRPAVAETLVDIGVDFGRLSTLRNLKHGLREALRNARRDRDGASDLDLFEEEEATEKASSKTKPQRS
ncbi:RsbR, positive regulator of sigma-B [Minicystis rosea]|nr:RsbR, positive regulator of sigma-B [Minicystis rosea]